MNSPAAERQIAGFVAKYTPEIILAIQASRQRMHALFPRGFELVYDNYNALVFGFSPSERSSGAFISLAAYPRWVTLFFLHGASLNDPEKLLRGTGGQVRSIRLAAPEDIDGPPVKALIKQAMEPVAAALAGAPVLSAVIKSISAKQRPRRPTVAKLNRPQPPAPGRLAHENEAHL